MTHRFFHQRITCTLYVFHTFLTKMIWHSKTEHDQTRQKAKKLLLSQKQLSAENKQLKEAQEKMNSELEDKNEKLKIYENESIKDKGTIGQIQNQLIDEQEMFWLFFRRCQNRPWIMVHDIQFVYDEIGLLIISWTYIRKRLRLWINKLFNYQASCHNQQPIVQWSTKRLLNCKQHTNKLFKLPNNLLNNWIPNSSNMKNLGKSNHN